MLRQPLEADSNEPITDQDNELLAKFKEYRYGPEKMTWDPNCYECKVRYRDPKAKDLVMYLHAWRYKVFYNWCRFICPLKIVQGLLDKLIYSYFRDRIGNSKRNYRNGPEKLQHKRMIEKTS